MIKFSYLLNQMTYFSRERKQLLMLIKIFTVLKLYLFMLAWRLHTFYHKSYITSEKIGRYPYFLSSSHLLPRPKTLFLERYYFHRRVVVCVSVCLAINSKSSWPILMKFGRMMYYEKIQVPFEDEINRIDRTHTSPKRVVKIDIKATYL